MALDSQTITALATLAGSLTSLATVVVVGILRIQDRGDRHGKHHDRDHEDDIELTDAEDALAEAEERVELLRKRDKHGKERGQGHNLREALA